MKNLLLLLLLVVVVGCKSAHVSSNIQESNAITLYGRAQNAAAGAILIAPRGTAYYIDGKEYWANDSLNSNFYVTGKLVVKKSSLPKGDKKYHGIDGDIYLIKDAVISSESPDEEYVYGTAMMVYKEAVVVTTDSIYYYLEGKSKWNKKHLNKEVKVTGNLLTRHSAGLGGAHFFTSRFLEPKITVFIP